MARPKETFAFAPNQPTSVIAWMEQLRAAGDGWLNLRPEAREEDEPVLEARPGLFSFLGGRQSTSVLCTWMPGNPRKREAEVTLGIMHPRGRLAPARLREAGCPVPDGWRVTQDHARRGLIIKVPDQVANARVVDWAVQAAELLSVEPLNGLWQAEVFPPLATSGMAPEVTGKATPDGVE